MSLNPATKLKNWEVSREHIEILKAIGKGAFCQVAKATVVNTNGIKGKKTVAVKMLKGELTICITQPPRKNVCKSIISIQLAINH